MLDLGTKVVALHQCTAAGRLTADGLAHPHPRIKRVDRLRHVGNLASTQPGQRECALGFSVETHVPGNEGVRLIQPQDRLGKQGLSCPGCTQNRQHLTRVDT